jgi:hypothetical protein
MPGLSKVNDISIGRFKGMQTDKKMSGRKYYSNELFALPIQITRVSLLTLKEKQLLCKQQWRMSTMEITIQLPNEKKVHRLSHFQSVFLRYKIPAK